jgi:hypothetical protein
MVFNISSDPTDRILIFKTFFILFALLAVYAGFWVGILKKNSLFLPEYVGKMNTLK